ncbi:MAG: TetR/AcrR family transcriptional regulator [Chloroflexus sp.]|uniref:TetR/AcrR family transcriptional regulator n=1 Tax=Chloroflexus sp. TaxID=1904827 RepID=UPI00404A401D
MSMTLRERRRRMLRDEILAAAQQLIAERGFAALAMDELAVRVGISKPTLYNQFPTREDLLAAMIARLIHDLFTAAAVGEPTDRSPLQQLCDLLHASIEFQIRHHAAAFQLWLPEVAELLEKHLQSRDELLKAQRRVWRLAEAAIANGEVAADLQPVDVIRTFSSLLCFPFVGGRNLPPAADPVATADLVVRIFQQGLQYVARPDRSAADGQVG